MTTYISYLPTLLRLRLIIGFLGERHQFAWWPTMFFDPSSRLFLEPVFVKTSRLAQYHGVVEAARRLHDEHLSVGSFHLFRLPEEVEQDLHSLMLGTGGLDVMTKTPLEKKVALQALTQIAAGTVCQGAGPTIVGQIKDLASPGVAQSIASAYESVFLNEGRCYPYLVG